MKLLMHVCCAPCFCAPLEELRGEGIEVAGRFYNPNIHPLLEFRKRLKAVKALQQAMNVDMIYDEDYGLTQFLRAVFDKPQPRCELCWGMRLDDTARLAKERGFDAFSTTLLISRHQDHDAIGRIGHEVGKQHGVEFFIGISGCWRSGRTRWRRRGRFICSSTAAASSASAIDTGTRRASCFAARRRM